MAMLGAFATWRDAMSETRWFSSKVDTWIAVVLAMGPVIAIGGAVASLIAGGPGAWVSLGSCLFMAAIYLGLVFPMRYGISKRELIVRHGLVRQRCKLYEIDEVYPTHNPLSSPALSLDRLWISKGKGFFDSIMISPKHKEEFLALLAHRAGLVRVGDRLVRRQEE
jgi:hypothetical protein